MRITDLFSSGHPFPSLEIVPPLSGITQRELLDSIRPLMDFQPRYINVTTHRDELQYTPLPDGSYKREVVRNRVSPVAVCACIQAHFPVEVVPHIICSGHTAREIEWQLQDFHFMGIDNVMALRGDSLAGEKRFTPEPDGYAHASELVRAIREQAGFCVGVGAYPEKHFEAANLETDIEYLKAKVDAGADYVITQMFFDNDVLPETFSIDIPRELTQAIRQAGDKAEAVRRVGIEWCIAQCRDLLAHQVPAIHFYTMGKSQNITDVLRAAF